MRYAFEGCVLDLDRRELRKDGALVDLEPQVFDVLAFLLRHRDRVVSRDDLIDGVWGGRIVSESALASRINAVGPPPGVGGAGRPGGGTPKRPQVWVGGGGGGAPMVAQAAPPTPNTGGRRPSGDPGGAQRLVKTIMRKGFRFVGEVREEDGAVQPIATGDPLAQAITFCRTRDDVGIAMSSVGEGAVLVKTANWLNHLEHDWQSPVWSPMWRRLASRFRLLRYDGRGCGLSDRDVADISVAGFDRDLEAVIDASKIDRFALLGLSQGVAAAVSYAARYPERVSHLILYGGYAQGRNRRGSPADAATAQTLLAMMQEGWGKPDSAFMRAFSTLYLSDTSRAHVAWFADLQRLSTSGEVAARLRVACDDIDILDLLPQVKVPTLVVHARRDNVSPLEQGRILAAKIPGARFVTLESENHIPVPDDPAWPQLLSEIEAFAATV